MRRYIHIFLTTLLFLTACEAEEYRTEFDQVQAELDELKLMFDEAILQLNTNLSALKAIVEASLANDYIESVQPFMKDGVEVGYVLSLTQGNEIVIYHGENADNGKDGEDMTTPAIGVKKDADGFWYWTSGDEWLLGSDGQKVRAEAVVPQFKIEDRCWYVSYDKGATWVKLARAAGADGEDGKDGADGADGKDGEDGEDGKDGEDGEDGADGKDAHCVFSEVKVTDAEVIFYLLSGEVFTLPRHGRLDVTFDVQNYETYVSPGAEIKINYTLQNATQSTKVSVSSDGNYIVRLERESYDSGVMTVKCPEVYKEGYVNFLMADGNGYVAVRVLNFFESRMEFADGMEYRIPAEGGIVKIPYAANFSYTLEVAEDALSWLTMVRTKATMEEAEIVVSATANTDSHTRVGKIHVIADNSDRPCAEIVVNQSSVVFTIDKASHEASVEGGDLLSIITSGDGLSASVQGSASAWILCEVVNTVENIYELKIKTYPNYGDARTGEIKLYSGDGSVYHGTVEINQNAMENERPEYMIFVVKTNMYDEGMVYLPLAGNLDCQVDWGDGTQEVVKKNLSYSNAVKVSHKYEVAQPSEFVVRVSGTVPQLSSYNILGHSVIEVKQWGLTGLTSLEFAFYGNQKLRSVANDHRGSFADVTDCSYMFYNCISLISLPDGLFDWGTKVTQFDNLCFGCKSLQYIAEGLFESCKNATTFSSAFSSCSSLQELPEALFSGLTEVTSFNYTFNDCSSIRFLPADLFAGCSSVTTYADAFTSCKSLEKVPEGLFDDSPLVKSFWYTFWLCTSLTEIPVSLFDNQRMVTTFQTAFGSCSKLTGESPYTIINGEKVHLYERKNYPDYFVRPDDATCFGSSKNLLDYSSIPESWR